MPCQEPGVTRLLQERRRAANCYAPGYRLPPYRRLPAARPLEYRHLIAAAHAAGLKIYGGTLTPFRGAFCYSAAGEAKREAVSHWIRASGAFDGVIDQAMADAVRLALFHG